MFKKRQTSSAGAPSAPAAASSAADAAAPTSPVPAGSASAPPSSVAGIGGGGVARFFKSFTSRRSSGNVTPTAAAPPPPSALPTSPASATPTSPASPSLTPSHSSSSSLSQNVWSEASRAVLQDWITAQLLPESHYTLCGREGPHRQRRLLVPLPQFYDDWRVQALPLQVAMARLRWGPTGEPSSRWLSVRLSERNEDEQAVKTMMRMVPRITEEAEQRKAQEQRQSAASSGASEELSVSATPTPNVTLEADDGDRTPTAVVDAVPSPSSKVASDTAERKERRSVADDDDDEERPAVFDPFSAPRINLHAINQTTLKRDQAREADERDGAVSPDPQEGDAAGEKKDAAAESEEDEVDEDGTRDDIASDTTADDDVADDKASQSSGDDDDDDPATSKPVHAPPKPAEAVSPSAADRPSSPQSASALEARTLLAALLLQSGDALPPANCLLPCTRFSRLDQQTALLVLCPHRLYVVHHLTIQAESKALALSHEPLQSALAAQPFHVTLTARSQHSAPWDAQTDSRDPSVWPLTPSGDVDTAHIDVVLQVDKIKKGSSEETTLLALQAEESRQRLDALQQGDWPAGDVFRCAYHQLTGIHRRRCNLTPTGVELFCADGSTHLLSFRTKKEREWVFQQLARRAEARLKAKAKSSDRDAASPTADVKDPSTAAATPSLDLGGGIVTLQKHLHAMTEQWQRRQVSNYAYLMFINTLAGRSFNDLTQYPVFPWVLSDYTSERLDLSDPRVYRDLSKPMGAIGEERARMFQDRYRTWEDPTGQIPRFHYGSCASSSAIVLYFLLRLHPFTADALRLQGGKFDHADRLFHDVGHAWYGASTSPSGLSDVKELIPEFYCTPSFLLNDDRWDLGEKQRGGYVDDVSLPPWAQGDAGLFVRRMREALESDHVSAHLHHWIDLMFGVKQRGKAAVRAQNVFYYLTYEDVVDVTKIEDPLEKQATIDQINHFGSTPHQLFKKPHPQRRPRAEAGGPGTAAGVGGGAEDGDLAQVTIASHPQLLHVADVQPNLSLVPSIPKGSRKPIGAIAWVDGLERLVVLDELKALIPLDLTKYISWGHPDHSLRVCVLEKQTATLRHRARQVHDIIVGHAGMHRGQITAALVTSDLRFLVTGGEDGIVCVHPVHVGRQRFELVDNTRALHGHQAAVTALAECAPYSLLLSGSSDCQVLVWDLTTFTLVRRLPPHPLAITCLTAHPLTGDVVTCSGPHAYVWSINGELMAERTVGASGSDNVTAAAVSQGGEGEGGVDYVLLTGTKEGVIKAWTLDVDTAHRRPPSTGRRASLSSSGNAFASSTGAAPSFTVASSATTTARPRPRVIRPGQVSLGTPYLVLTLRQTLYGSGSSLTVLHTHPTTPSRFWSGDRTGNVVCWDLSNQDHWQKDGEANECALCERRFTVIERRHHCRKCGRCVCGKCSTRKQELPELAYNKPVRVCNGCWTPVIAPLHSAKPII